MAHRRSWTVFPSQVARSCDANEDRITASCRRWVVLANATKRLLSPALSSIGWRRGGESGARTQGEPEIAVFEKQPPSIDRPSVCGSWSRRAFNGWRSVLSTILTGLILGELTLMTFGCSNRTPSVTLYCAQDQVFAEPILAGSRQTGIRVKTVFDSEAVKTVALAHRLLAERDHPVADVFWGNERVPDAATGGPGVLAPDWVAFGQRTRRLVVNTNLVAVGNRTQARGLPTAPAGLIDLTNAVWRGRVSLAFPLFGTTSTHFLALRDAWGLKSNWLAWCRMLADNRPFWRRETRTSCAGSGVAKRPWDSPTLTMLRPDSARACRWRG